MRQHNFTILFWILTISALLVSCGGEEEATFTSETIDGVLTVNNAQAKWEKDSPLKIEFVRSLGSLDAEEEAYNLYLPDGIVADKDKNMYVLDSGNLQVKKFDKNGKFLKQIGREGQGPGEFKYPGMIAITASQEIFVHDSGNNKIDVFNTAGDFVRTHKNEGNFNSPIIMSNGNLLQESGGGFFFGSDDGNENSDEKPLFKITNIEDEELLAFGKMRFVIDDNTTPGANSSSQTVDSENNVYAAFSNMNRLEKYSPEGKLVMSITRPLKFEELIEKTEVERFDGGGISIRSGKRNKISKDIAIDAKKRIWVLTYDRQEKDNEKVSQSISVSDGVFVRTVEAKEELESTDMYRLDVFSPEGVLLTMIPIDKFADSITIIDNQLYILDRMRNSQFFIYDIIN